MSIVLKENEWAEEMIRQKEFGKKPLETLTRVCRYYYDKGYDKKGTRDMLEKFILQCDPNASIPKWSGTIDIAVSKAGKKEAICIDGVFVTDKEIKTIKALNGVQTQRLAFTLLCLSKYWDKVHDHNDHWVNTRDSEIMHMANINTSIKRQSLMYNQLNASGLIQFSKKVSNTNVRVLFSEETEKGMLIDDFRNLGNQYMMLGSDQYISCELCGIVVRRTNIGDTLHKVDYKRQRYCKRCAADIRIRRNVERVMDIVV